MTEDRRPGIPSSWLSRPTIEGFLIGAGGFAILSFAAPQIWSAVSDSVCALEPGQRFVSGVCLLGGAVSSALWLGPAGPLFMVFGLEVGPLAIIPVTSGLLAALVAALLFRRYGRRRGFAILAAASLVGILCLASYDFLFLMTS